MGAYPRLLAFIQKHLPDRFYLEGTQRISIRDIIFREVVANLLVHREFSNAYPATMTIYADRVETENWNRPYMMGRISLDNLKPHPKNPTIANFFKQLGWVEELGSGVRKMYKYCPIYFEGATPIIEEGDVFKLTIIYDELIMDDRDNDRVNIKSDRDDDRVSLNEKQKEVLLFCSIPRTSREILQQIDMVYHPDAIKLYIKALVDAELLVMTIPDKPNSRLQKYVVREEEIELQRKRI